jgi:hydroxypyruvate reductase
VIEAGHPVPDAAGLAATRETLTLAQSASADDLVLVLVSGGASANWVAPAEGVSLGEKQALTRALLASGASIAEINAVRKHLSRIKGGRLAERISPARSITLAISDVPGDDPAVIGSGPTVADPTTLADAKATLALSPHGAAGDHASACGPGQRDAKPGSPVFANASFILACQPSCVHHDRSGGARRRL